MTWYCQTLYPSHTFRNEVEYLFERTHFSTLHKYDTMSGSLVLSTSNRSVPFKSVCVWGVGGGGGREDEEPKFLLRREASNSELLYPMRLDMIPDRRREWVSNFESSSVPPPTTLLNGTVLNEVEYLFSPIFQHYITIQ